MVKFSFFKTLSLPKVGITVFDKNKTFHLIIRLFFNSTSDTFLAYIVDRRGLTPRASESAWGAF